MRGEKSWNKSTSLDALIAPIHLNVDHLNLDLKHRMWVQVYLVGRNFYLRCRSFRIKWIQKQLWVLHLVFHNCHEFKRIPFLKIPHKSVNYPQKPTIPPSPHFITQFKSIRNAFRLTTRLWLKNWLFTHTHFFARSQCWYGEYSISILLFQVCTTRSTAVSGKHVHRGRWGVGS